MKDHQPAEGTDSSVAELHVHPAGDDLWSWRYFDPGAGIELHCNETFDSREAAVESARRAYPDVPFGEEKEAGAKEGEEKDGEEKGGEEKEG